MILDATTRKLQILMDATATTTESPIVANWVDMTTTSTTPGSSNSISNGTTAVDVVAAPAASTQRVIQSMSIYNADTVNRTVTVRYNDNATTRIIIKILLLPAQSLTYNTHDGWEIPQGVLQGANKASFSATKNAVDQGAVTSATFTKVTFTTEVWDIGSYYDAVNSKWVPPAGKVIMNACVAFNTNVVDAQPMLAVIYKNGGAFKWNRHIPGAASQTAVEVTAQDDANGTDYYEVYAYAAGASDKTIEGDATDTYFQGSSL